MLRSLSLSLLILTSGSLPLGNALASTQWQIGVSDASPLPTLSIGGVNAFNSSFSFWGKNWAWANLESTVKPEGGFRYSMTGQNKALNFDVATKVGKTAQNKMHWEFELDAKKQYEDVNGGGLIFKFDLGKFSKFMGEPSLLPDNRGWRWGLPGGKQQIEMRFEPALPTVYFERGNKSQVRAFFYSKQITPGIQRFSATLTFSGDIAFQPTVSERFGSTDASNWPSDQTDTKTVPVDLSFLNNDDKPAGRRGHIKANNEQLVFEDGTPARFWGTNVTAYALFNTPRDLVKQQAKRLAALGFNLVRIHHHDSPWVNPNIFGNSKFVKNSLTLNSASLDKLDWWVKCLKDEGIYIWLDMHAQRAFKEEDQIYGFDEIRKNNNFADLKGYNYVNLTIIQAMKRFNEDYLNHKNIYTGIFNKNEPAVIALLITNENDITSHFGNNFLPDKKVPDHNKIYMSEAGSFAKTSGLPKDKIWRSWEPGPAKIFLNDLERRFNVNMIEHLRKVGTKSLIATTNTWGYNPLSSLPALTSGDLIDVHSYGGYGQLETSPLFGPNLVHWMAAGQVVGKPMSITEWNAEPFPLPDRHTLPLYVAASAKHQGWDALMHYAYTQEPTDRNSASNWHGYNDPSLISMFPAAALLYRQGHVKEATTAYVFDPGSEVFFNQIISPANSVALRTAAEKGKLLIAMPQTKELPWLERKPFPAGATILRDPNQSVIAAEATESASDTGELKHNWEKGIYTINTAQTQAAMGWIGGQPIALSDAEIRLTSKNASVAIQSMDGKSIGKSKDILVSLAGRSLPKPGNKGPFTIEPLEGLIKINAPKGLSVFRKGAFQKEIEVPFTYSNGTYLIKLDGKQPYNWLFIKPQ